MKNLVGIWCNLFRAIEIAKTGGHSISIHFAKDYKQGFDDYLSIKNFCKGWFDNFVSDGDMKVELVKPKIYNNGEGHETLDGISKRVEETLNFKVIDTNLKPVSESLLNTATQKLDLSLSQVEKIKEIALTIAQMDFSKSIEAQHIAEAIQYFCIGDDLYNAESKSISFGDKIRIGIGNIDSDSINSAIDYLNGLLINSKS